jgi:hypothetical protein
MINHKSCRLHFLLYCVTNINRFEKLSPIENDEDDGNRLHSVGFMKKEKFTIHG